MFLCRKAGLVSKYCRYLIPPFQTYLIFWPRKTRLCPINLFHYGQYFDSVKGASPGCESLASGEGTLCCWRLQDLTQYFLSGFRKIYISSPTLLFRSGGDGGISYSYKTRFIIPDCVHIFAKYFQTHYFQPFESNMLLIREHAF